MKNLLSSNKFDLFLLCALIALGGFLRFYKLDWGQGFYFHPDEYHIAIAVDRLNFPNNMNPEFFSYGSLSVYLIYFSKLALGIINADLLKINPILVGRFFSAFFSTATLILIYFICRKILSEKKFALLAVFLTAVVPGLVQQAHFATPESILTFWLFATLALWLKWLESYKIKYLLLSSFTLGAGAATKIVASVYLPLLLFVFAINTPFLKTSLLKKFKNLFSAIFLLIFSAFTFLIIFPFSLLDKKGFLYSMRYETSVAQGKQLVFYTRQFINTTPFIFHLQKVFPYTLGPTVFFFATVGLLFIVFGLINGFVRKKVVDKKMLIVALSFLAYLIPNLALFAKWTRFTAPSLPFFCIFSVYTLNIINNKKTELTKTATLLVTILIIFTGLWSIMFFSVYTKEDIRLTATSWINKNIPKNSTIATEEGNTLEVPLSGNYDKRVFNFYNLDQPALKNDLPNLLTSSDYFIIQSRRVFANHQRLPNEFRDTAAFYDKLFSGELGYTELEKFSSFPSLKIGGFKLEIDDETAEETWSVFDHPVIRIFKKTGKLTANDYQKILGY